MLMLMTMDKGTGMAPFASARVDVAPILRIKLKLLKDHDHVDNLEFQQCVFLADGANIT